MGKVKDSIIDVLSSECTSTCTCTIASEDAGILCPSCDAEYQQYLELNAQQSVQEETECLCNQASIKAGVPCKSCQSKLDEFVHNSCERKEDDVLPGSW